MYWREAGRPVAWTREGKLVYTDTGERDALLLSLKQLLSRIIRHKHTEGFTNDALADVCKAIRLREEELNAELL